MQRKRNILAEAARTAEKTAVRKESAVTKRNNRSIAVDYLGSSLIVPEIRLSALAGTARSGEKQSFTIDADIG